MDKPLILSMEEKYSQYLYDESKLAGKADSISFPASKEEVVEIVLQMKKAGIPITVQGGKTGIVGSGVPYKGHILNLGNMKQVKKLYQSEAGEYFLDVEPGITLLELKNEIDNLKAETALFWPPDPTETSATVGGVASCNGKGICAHLYGETRDYITQIEIVDPAGTVRRLKRGEKEITSGSGQDEMELFLGGEGMYGAITMLTLRLLPKPKEMWGICFFFEAVEDVLQFAERMQEKELKNEGAALAAAEYLDRVSIDLVEKRKDIMSKVKELPDIPKNFSDMLYLEIHGREEEAIMELAEQLMEIAVGCNSDPDQAWAMSGQLEIEKLRAFRHGAAEAVNEEIDKLKRTEPRITKLGTDMCSPQEELRSVLLRYRKDIRDAGLKACIFGHILEHHFHVNLLPESYEEYEAGTRLVESWAKEIVGHRGAFVTEHGVGKLKRPILWKVASQEYLEEMKRIKSSYDPLNLWNPGNSYTDQEGRE